MRLLQPHFVVVGSGCWNDLPAIIAACPKDATFILRDMSDNLIDQEPKDVSVRINNVALRSAHRRVVAHGLNESYSNPARAAEWELRFVSESHRLNQLTICLNGAYGNDPAPVLKAVADASDFIGWHCVTGDTRVASLSGRVATKRWHEGQFVHFSIASGEELTVTPNHPVLTDIGWISAHLLRPGMRIARALNRERVHALTPIWLRGPDDQDIPPSIEQVFCTALKSGGMMTDSMPTTTEDFHGDGRNGYVDVIRPLSLASYGSFAERHEPFRNLAILDRYPNLLEFPSFGSAAQMEMAGYGPSSTWLSLREKAEDYPKFQKPTFHSDVSGSILLGDISQGRSVAIEFSPVVGIDIRTSKQHVYNLSTDEGWYLANGIIAHNCYDGWIENEQRFVDRIHTSRRYAANWLADYTHKMIATETGIESFPGTGQRRGWHDMGLSEVAVKDRLMTNAMEWYADGLLGACWFTAGHTEASWNEGYGMTELMARAWTKLPTPRENEMAISKQDLEAARIRVREEFLNVQRKHAAAKNNQSFTEMGAELESIFDLAGKGVNVTDIEFAELAKKL